MSTLTQFFGGASGPSFINEKVFISQRTFVTPVKGTYLLTAIGGGGSGGGGNVSSTASSNYYSGAGGGAGAFCQSIVKLNAGVTLTLTVGSGGASVAAGISSGNSGGASSIAGAGFTTLLASGGAGGQGGIVSSTTRLGGNGGSASGGNLLNVTGQAGHNSTGSPQATSGAGGSTGIFGYTPTGTTGALESDTHLATSMQIWNQDPATYYIYSGVVQPFFGRYLDPKGQVQGIILSNTQTTHQLRRYGRCILDGQVGGNIYSVCQSGEFSGGSSGSGNSQVGKTGIEGGHGGGGGSGAGYYWNGAAYVSSNSGIGGDGRCVIEWAPVLE